MTHRVKEAEPVQVASSAGRGVSEHLPLKKSSGKSSGKSRGTDTLLPLVATDEEIELDDGEITGVTRGWRLEKNSDGYYRWRWQKKNEDGTPKTYVNKNGKTVYMRGSKYVGKKED